VKKESALQANIAAAAYSPFSQNHDPSFLASMREAYAEGYKAGMQFKQSDGRLKAYWEADLGTAVDVVVRLSDNGLHDSKAFIAAAIERLNRWTI
jgi:hypothetical protein